jgi:hypothetical protein
MNSIKASTRISAIAFAIITAVFLAVISPLKGFGPITFPLILSGIGLWIASLIVLIIGLVKKERRETKRVNLVVVVLLILGFLPVGYLYMGISGDVRTKITINLTNQSGVNLDNVLIYGTGALFEGEDTLRIGRFENSQEIKYIIRPSTEPQKGGGKKGNVEMQFEMDGEIQSKIIAGEFSVYPLNIKQEWEVLVDQHFLNE